MEIEQELIKLEKELNTALDELDSIDEQYFLSFNKLSELIEKANKIGDYDLASEQTYIVEEYKRLKEISQSNAEEMYALLLYKRSCLAQRNLNDEENMSFNQYFLSWKLNKNK